MSAAAITTENDPLGVNAPRRRHMPKVLAVLAIVANVLWLVPLRADTGGLLVVLGLLGAVAFAAAGAVAMHLRPDSPIGAAMIALAFVLNLGEAAAETMLPWRYTIGKPWEGIPTALLAILALCFPGGRPRGRAAWLLCVGLGGFIVSFFVIALLWFLPKTFCWNCPPAGNLLFQGNAPFDIYSVTPLLVRVYQVLLVLTMVTLLARWLRASRPSRRVLSPILLTTVLLAAKRMWDFLVLAGAVWHEGFADFRLVIIYPDQVLNALIPLMFLVAVGRSEFGRSPLARLLTDVVDERTSTRVDKALQAALGDPSLRVGYRTGAGTFVDPDGQPLELPDEGAASRATFVPDPGGAFAVIVHDAALDYDDRQLQAATAAAGMMLRRERLQAQLHVRLQQLSNSRARLIHAVDDQRLRIESALERGVEDRLNELSSVLHDLRGHVNDTSALEALEDVAAEVGRARSDLRSFVRDVRPAVIAADGLKAALHDVARSAPVPVTVRRAPDHSVAPAVEAAIWFVCAESLVNVAKHAHATHASVDVYVDGDTAHVSVTDDGVGGAAEGRGTGLRGLRERLDQMGGTLSLTSEPGHGTAVRADVPLTPTPARAQ